MNRSPVSNNLLRVGKQRIADCVLVAMGNMSCCSSRPDANKQKKAKNAAQMQKLIPRVRAQTNETNESEGKSLSSHN